jgi:hypothetical protein
MSYPAHDTNPPRAPARRGDRRRKRGILAVLAGSLTLAAAIGCASIAPTFIHQAKDGSSHSTALQRSATGHGRSPKSALASAIGLVTPPPPGGSGGKAPGGRTATPGGPSGLTSGNALFGGSVPLLADQGKLGRTLAIVRIYDYIGQPFNNPSVDKMMAAGSTLLVSLDTDGPSYASIAAGHQDATISSFLRQMNQAAITYHLNAIYIDFEHEADLSRHGRFGTPAEFVRAWDHIHGLATAMHLDWNQGGRLHWALILTHFAYRDTHPTPQWPGAGAFWPGTRDVDIVAADAYNTSTCRTAKPGTNLVAKGTAVQTPADLFTPVLTFAAAHGGLPVFLAEWGTVPYVTPWVQPQFIHQMQDFVTANHQIGAALYWDAHGQGGCNYILDNRPASLAALATMGHAPGLQAGALQHG